MKMKKLSGKSGSALHPALRHLAKLMEEKRMLQKSEELSERLTHDVEQRKARLVALTGLEETLSSRWEDYVEDGMRTLA